MHGKLSYLPDIIGLNITITASKNPSDLDAKGLVIFETARMIVLRSTNTRDRRYYKKNIQFKVGPYIVAGIAIKDVYKRTELL